MEQNKGTQWVPKKQEDPGLLARLSRPTGPVDVVLDTDTYNEIDDQFAVSYLICSAEKLHLQAIYAAPFFNEKSTGPADGMEKSYQEILNILTLMGKDLSIVLPFVIVFISSLTDENTLIRSGRSGGPCNELYSGKTAVCACNRRHHKCGFCNFEKSGYYRPDRDRMAGRQCTALAGKQRI